jgi:hypothetical protein
MVYLKNILYFRDMWKAESIIRNYWNIHKKLY